MQFCFENHVLDADRRELRRGSELVALEPQVFDLLVYLVQNRDRVVSKDDLIASVWGGRIVSDSTLTSRINAARKAVGDSGEEQKLIRTIARKGIRFVCAVNEPAAPRRRGPRPTIAGASRPAAGDSFLHRFRWRSHRLRARRPGTAAGQVRQLAQPSRIRLAKSDLEPPSACACGRASADPL